MSQDRADETTALIQTPEQKAQNEATVPIVLLRPSRRFERMLARELARSRQQCGTHCWEQLKESLPEELRQAKKEVRDGRIP